PSRARHGRRRVHFLVRIVVRAARGGADPRWYARRVIPMALMGVRVEVPTNQPIVLLREEGGSRYLPIFIGPPEATAIVYALQGMDTPRPMPHDLFKTVLDGLDVTVERVEITSLHDGTFYAEIEFDRECTKSRISSRPSDAIALAVRFGAEVPIF